VRRFTPTLAALALLALAPVSSVSAATTVGQAPPTDGFSFNCGPGYGAQLSSASGTGYAIPSPGGVITSWRSSANGTVGFTLWTGVGTTLTLAAEDQKTIAGVLTEFPLRIPVSGGERIGLHIVGFTPGCLNQTGLGGDQIGVAGAASLGAAVPLSPQGGYRFNVAVTVEADADKDGFGDESQDLCPTDASIQVNCPDVVSPDTTIGKHPAKKTGKRRAKFSFTANEPVARFECKLDKGRFRQCKSPYRRKVGPGRHSFRVRAVDLAGNVDPAAARFSWTVLD
jgi:hypothetical protein